MVFTAATMRCKESCTVYPEHTSTNNSVHKDCTGGMRISLMKWCAALEIQVAQQRNPKLKVMITVHCSIKYTELRVSYKPKANAVLVHYKNNLLISYAVFVPCSLNVPMFPKRTSGL